MSNYNLNFAHRFAINDSPPISNEIPENARIALAHTLSDFDDKGYLNTSYKNDSSAFLRELYRIGRFTEGAFNIYNEMFFYIILGPLKKLKWYQLYALLERIYDCLLVTPKLNDSWSNLKSLADIQQIYSEEINNWLSEENLAYQFVDGLFQRHGRPVTQQNIQKVGKILADPSLINVRNHFNKARKFFDQIPEADVENCVKESVCALEACIQVLSKSPNSKKFDFTTAIKQLRGNEPRKIPQPIAEGMIKLYGYRGGGQGVAHAALNGNKVTQLEAELVMNLAASYITYLVDLLQETEEDIPF